jgi:hypothetical protein
VTKEELAALLNGREYGREVYRREERLAAESRLVVAFGSSDDLLELRGAIDDEIGAYNGTTVLITPDGLLKNKCEYSECPYFHEKILKTKDTVTAIWDKDGYSWVIESTLPYAPFDIMEDGEKYCRGIVFCLPT